MPASPTPVRARLAAIAADMRYETLPAEVVHEAKRLILDTVGCAIGGWHGAPCAGVRALAGELGGRAVEEPPPAEIVVNCTSVGLADRDATFKALPLQADSLDAGSCVVDMVYRDGGTRLLEAARTRGADVIDGLEILVAQGAASFERWTGRTAPREAMRAAVGAIAST